MRIAILEDDPVQAGFVSDTLSAAGHVCHEFSEGRALVETLRRQTFDLLVLDWGIPDMSGEEVLWWVRQNLPEYLPVIFMTARGRDSDVASILNAGADDYLIKPVSAAILRARITALLRRAYRDNSARRIEIFGDFQFDLLSSNVLLNGLLVPLTQREFALALLLFQNLGRPLSRAHILEIVWKRAANIPSRTLDTHISSLRTKLGLRPKSGYRLATVYGYGYQLHLVQSDAPG